MIKNAVNICDYATVRKTHSGHNNSGKNHHVVSAPDKSRLEENDHVVSAPDKSRLEENDHVMIGHTTAVAHKTSASKQTRALISLF